MQKYTIILLASILSACSFVSLNPAAKDVVVAAPYSEPVQCKLLGTTTVSVWDKAGTFQSAEKTESQLDTLARNQATTMQGGGNTVVATSAIENGKRSYKVYNCTKQ